MRSRFDEDGNPDIKVVVAQYRDAMKRRIRWLGPAFGFIIVLLLAWRGVYSVNPGEVGVVRTFGKETGETQPGLHFLVPIAQRVDIVDIATIRREEIGFTSGESGAKRIDSEALMLTGDENIIEAQMIVQYQINDPTKYLFRLKDAEKTLHIAAEVALRGVVGQMRITSSIEELSPSAPVMKDALEAPTTEPVDDKDKPEEADDKPEEKPDDKQGDKPDDKPEEKTADAGDAPTEPPLVAPHAPLDQPDSADDTNYNPEMDILTKGRERAQVATKEMLQHLMDLYESGLKITEVKLQVVDAPDEVKDAFHDVVRAREEREQLINKALGYREDRIPKARGEAQKVIRAGEAYRRERVLRAEGEAARFNSILAEYRKARNVTRERIHLETLERILGRVPKKIFIDSDVAQNTLPFLPLGSGSGPLSAGEQGGQ
jgi:regulator of protease activity HflC (stomatin/prohibitin superfamily)